MLLVKIDDIFRYSPDLTSKEWHVEGKEETHELVVVVPTGKEGKEEIVGVSVQFSGGVQPKRAISLHILDMNAKSFMDYKQTVADSYMDILANAVFDIRKKQRQDPSIVIHDEMRWNILPSGIDTDFSTPAFSSREKYNHITPLLNGINTAIK